MRVQVVCVVWVSEATTQISHKYLGPKISPPKPKIFSLSLSLSLSRILEFKMCQEEEQQLLQQRLIPCLQCQPQECIRMVQHLIERCLILHMDRDECVTALTKHARIHPTVTLTVWEGLLKENKEFFTTYSTLVLFQQRNSTVN